MRLCKWFFRMTRNTPKAILVNGINLNWSELESIRINSLETDVFHQPEFHLDNPPIAAASLWIPDSLDAVGLQLVSSGRFKACQARTANYALISYWQFKINLSEIKFAIQLFIITVALSNNGVESHRQIIRHQNRSNQNSSKLSTFSLSLPPSAIERERERHTVRWFRLFFATHRVLEVQCRWNQQNKKKSNLSTQSVRLDWSIFN